MDPNIGRRHFLRSASACLALPALASLGFRRFAGAAPALARPKRVVFLAFGWGVTRETWFPDLAETGADYTLPAGLSPLARHKADFTIVQGCSNKFSNEAHWGSTFWLTGANRYSQPGQSFANSVSVDQVAAAHLGKSTRFPSLQLGTHDALEQGHGPGLSLAWDERGKPIAGLDQPVQLFHRLFSAESTSLEERKTQLAQKRSVLDLLRDDLHRLQRKLSSSDRQKVEEYAESIREIETRLSRELQWVTVPKAQPPFIAPHEKLGGREEIQTMYDLMVAAMKSDASRVFTYRQPVNSLLKDIGVPYTGHDLSHYERSQGDRMEFSQKRDVAQSAMLATFLDKLKASQEEDGSSLFDHVTVGYGSNISSVHFLNNCPTLLAGGGAGIRLGHHLALPKGTPLCDVWLTLLHGLGVNAERHGDSTGPVKQLRA